MIKAYWFKGCTRNFGDEITPLVLKRLTGDCVLYDDKRICFGGEVICSVGSILQLRRSFLSDVVWGSGVISDKSKKLFIPKKILATRGPRTKFWLGVNVKIPFGDPGLLVPSLMEISPGQVKFDVGLVLHYVDIGLMNKNSLIDSVAFIDVRRAVEDVVGDISKCDRVVSSSLHGLVIAVSLGIPFAWVKCSNAIIGDDFKFYDFFEGIGIVTDGPQQLCLGDSLIPQLNKLKFSQFTLDVKYIENLKSVLLEYFRK